MHIVEFDVTPGAAASIAAPLVVGLQVGSPPAGQQIDAMRGECATITSDGLPRPTAVMDNVVVGRLESGAAHRLKVYITLSRA